MMIRRELVQLVLIGKRRELHTTCLHGLDGLLFSGLKPCDLQRIGFMYEVHEQRFDMRR